MITNSYNSMMGSVELVELLVNSHSVYTSLMHALDTVSVWRLSSTCRTLFELIRPYEWNINRSLTRFVDDPLVFRKKIRDVGGVISGGFVLQFLDRQEWPNSDLDVYVDDVNACYSVMNFLVEFERYMVEDIGDKTYSDLIYPGLHVCAFFL
jgi:hypothetical protein